MRNMSWCGTSRDYETRITRIGSGFTRISLVESIATQIFDSTTGIYEGNPRKSALKSAKSALQ